MRLKILCILMGVGVGSLGASSLAAQGRISYETPRRPEVLTQPPEVEQDSIDPEKAYTQRRWIGLRQGGGGCPDPGVAGWKSQPLVDRASLEGDSYRRVRFPEREAADKALLERLGLDRFCVYTPTSSESPAFVPPPGLVAARDRMALSANAESLDQRVSPVLAEHFLRQTGKLSLPLQGGPTVRLTFLDSQPTSDAVPAEPPPGPQHGYTLAQLARQLVCHGPCAATIASRRALQYNDFDRERPLAPQQADSDHGGSVGLVSELAAAIVEEVLAWRQAGDSKHLILNLSLGWDGEIFGDLDAPTVSKMEPSVQAVYGALRFAARRGVLVIAAAGNRRGGPKDSSLPLLPAAWEIRRPPCFPFCFGPKRIYSVGGVDWQGLTLPNSRRGGCPRRVAYGDHAAASVEDRLTPIYTGTSVSAAVVSSIAAVVWHLRPELRPAQVMKLIGRSGQRLETQADFYPWREAWPLSHLLPAPHLRQASLCAAVARACGPGAARCRPTLASAPVCPPLDQQPPALSSLFADTRPQEVPFIQTSLPPSYVPPCAPSTRLLTPDGHVPFAPCPTSQYSGVTNQRWLLPQPEDVPCPGCTLVPKPPTGSASIEPSVASSTEPDTELYTLEMEISEDWRTAPPGTTLESATLEIDCSNRSGPLTYPISFVQTTAGLQAMTNLGDGRSLLGCKAQLNFVVVTPEGERASLQNPVVVDP